MTDTTDYSTRSRVHRPRTREEMRTAVHELASRGLGDHDIAAACELSVEQVRRMLAERAAP